MLLRRAPVVSLALFLLLGGGVVACAHGPETVVHLSAPGGGAWTVRDPRGAPLCTLPCSVELDEHETVVVHHSAGKQFVVQQDSLGEGVFSGSVRTRKELGPGAQAVQAVSGALASAGTTMIAMRRDDRVAVGVVLTGLGAAGVLITEALGGKKVEELWLEKISSR